MWNVEAISNPSQYCCLVWIGVYLVPMQRVITQSLTRHQEMMWDGTVVDDVTAAAAADVTSRRHCNRSSWQLAPDKP